jgi:hypothetical protein
VLANEEVGRYVIGGRRAATAVVEQADA